MSWHCEHDCYIADCILIYAVQYNAHCNAVHIACHDAVQYFGMKCVIMHDDIDSNSSNLEDNFVRGSGSSNGKQHDHCEKHAWFGQLHLTG